MAMVGVASVTLWGFGMGVVQSYSMPAQQAILNRVSGSAVQRRNGDSHRVYCPGRWIGITGQIDRIGATQC